MKKKLRDMSECSYDDLIYTIIYQDCIIANLEDKIERLDKQLKACIDTSIGQVAASDRMKLEMILMGCFNNLSSPGG